MLYAIILFAQEGVEKAPDPAKDGSAGGLNMLLPMLLIMAAFFFLIILPAQRREKKQRETIMTSLKKNDEVVTASGIIGIVHTIKDTDEVILKIDDNARMRVLKSSIVRIVTKDDVKDAAATPPASTDVKPA